MISLKSGVKMVLMKKPIKFKDNICSVKQYAQIIFETKNRGFLILSQTEIAEKKKLIEK